MRWTEQEFADYNARRAQKPADVSHPPFKMPPNEAGHFALGRLSVGTMNKTEAAYDAHLQEQRHAGAVLWHRFEGVKLRLADNTFYTCDFAVLPASGVLEMHEVKGGFWMEDARVKIKVAAALYPFRFIAVTKRRKCDGGGWNTEEF